MDCFLCKYTAVFCTETVSKWFKLVHGRALCRFYRVISLFLQRIICKMTENKRHFLMLKSLTEERFGHSPGNPTDFNRLSIRIAEVTGESVSSSTLKRYWGYVSSNQTPSARFCRSSGLRQRLSDYRPDPEFDSGDRRYHHHGVGSGQGLHAAVHSRRALPRDPGPQYKTTG